MIQAHAQLYDSLTPEEAGMLWGRLHDAGLVTWQPDEHSEQITGAELASACSHLSHAQVILALASEASEHWIAIMSKLLVRPIYMAARGETGDPLTDVQGRPLRVPIGHRRGEPAMAGRYSQAIVSKVRTRVVARQDPRIIEWVQDVNPKAPGSGAHARFALYRSGMSVDEFIAAGGTRGDVTHDSAKGFIRVGGAPR